MRKTVILFLCSAFLLLCLSSCGQTPTDGDCLGYQSRPFELSAGITVDGRTLSCKVVSTPSDRVAVTVTEQGRLQGLCFEIADGMDRGLSVTLDGITFPIDGEYAEKNGLPAAAALFRLEKSSFCGAEVIKTSGVRINAADFRFDFGSARVFLGENGLPVRIEGNIYGHEITVTVENFNLIRE